MSHRISLKISLALLVAGLSLASSASATSILIKNPSFEAPVIVIDGNAVPASDNGWDLWGSAYWQQITNTPPAWIAGSEGNAAPPNGDGANSWCIFMHGGEAYNYENGFAAQTLEATVQPGTYTLTAAMGCPADASYTTVHSLMGITTSDVGYGTGLVQKFWTPDQLPVGAFAEFSASVAVAAGDPSIGKTLQIYIGGRDNNESGTGALAIDNVRLTFTPVPEPGTLVLACVGVIGTVCYAWRKRGSLQR